MHEAGASVSSDQLALLVRYFGLLTKWNKTVNLTALMLDPPSPGAVDRLLIEPLLAATIVRREAVEMFSAATDANRKLRLLDVGSGGGSPAIPLAIALLPLIELHMVESRGRKAAFLREAGRQLNLPGAQVHSARVEELPSTLAFDLVSIRAVRTDAPLWKAIAGLVRPGGLLAWFHSVQDGQIEGAEFAPMFVPDNVTPLVPGSELVVLRRT